MEEEKIQSPKESEKPPSDAKESESTAPVAPVNVSKVCPPRDTNNAETNTKKRKRKPLSCFEIWTIGLAIIGILITAGTGGAIIWQDIIASRTLVELQRQYPQLDKSATAAKTAADAAVESLNMVQRAYISLGDIGGSRNAVSSNPKTISLTMMFPWENAGYTPTREMKTHVSKSFYNHGLPKDWDFPDLWAGTQPHTYTSVVVSPHGKAVYYIGVTNDEIGRIQKHERLFFWGWARYHDVFEKTPEHITEFCMELEGFFGNVFSPNLNENVGPSLKFCDNSSHNCQDQECKDNQTAK